MELEAKYGELLRVTALTRGLLDDAEAKVAELEAQVADARKEGIRDLLAEYDRMFDPLKSHSAWLHAEARDMEKIDAMLARTAPKEQPA